MEIITVNASTGSEDNDDPAEEQKIREVIQKYFDQRYRSHAVNQIEDFNELMDGSSHAESFLKSESDKLEIEFHNAELHHLRYTRYSFTLKFNKISIDEKTNLPPSR